MSTSLKINGKSMTVEAEPDTPLLWVIRDEIGLTGTKFGCGAALCGACTVHLEGQPIRSCSTPLSAAAGKNVSTIEAMSSTEIGKKGLKLSLPALSWFSIVCTPVDDDWALPVHIPSCT